MENTANTSPSPATLRLNRKIRPLFLSEALCPHHCPEHAFDDDFMERADQGEIGDSQFVVVLHQCAEVNVPALDIDRQIGFQVLVVEADDISSAVFAATVIMPRLSPFSSASFSASRLPLVSVFSPKGLTSRLRSLKRNASQPGIVVQNAAMSFSGGMRFVPGNSPRKQSV